MVKRGALKVPVIGIAFPNWNLARLHKRITDSIKRPGGFDNKRAVLSSSELSKLKHPRVPPQRNHGQSKSVATHKYPDADASRTAFVIRTGQSPYLELPGS